MYCKNFWYLWLFVSIVGGSLFDCNNVFFMILILEFVKVYKFTDCLNLFIYSLSHGYSFIKSYAKTTQKLYKINLQKKVFITFTLLLKKWQLKTNCYVSITITFSFSHQLLIAVTLSLTLLFFFFLSLINIHLYY